jgi:hypothetical protein
VSSLLRHSAFQLFMPFPSKTLYLHIFPPKIYEVQQLHPKEWKALFPLSLVAFSKPYLASALALKNGLVKIRKFSEAAPK